MFKIITLWVSLSSKVIVRAFLEAEKSSSDISKIDEKIAKQCCNYDFKQKAGYCITLSAPYKAFKVPKKLFANYIAIVYFLKHACYI
jgi:hypothetical protein